MSYRGFDLIGQLDRELGRHDKLSLKFSSLREDREQLQLDQLVDSFDFELLRDRKRRHHHLVYGGGFRFVGTETTPSSIAGFLPATRHDRLYSLFVQDEWEYRPNCFLIMGSRFEHNDYTGFEYEPTLRFRWNPRKDRSYWLAASRAIRTPARIDFDLRYRAATIPGAPVTEVVFFGSDSVETEVTKAYEAGFRLKPNERTFFDTTFFFNEHNNLLDLEMGSPFIETSPPPLRAVLPSTFANGGHGHSRGVEFKLGWEASSRCKVDLAYSHLDMAFSFDNPPATPGTTLYPRNQWVVRSRHEIGSSFEVDQIFTYVGSLEDDIADRTRYDIRVGWQPKPGMDVSFVVQNLFDQEDVEIATEEGSVSSRTGRRWYGKVSWRF